jgi:hypothetical protein
MSLTGIATDGTEVWVVNVESRRLFRYAGAAAQRAVVAAAAGSFALHVVGQYVEHYHKERPHQGKGNEPLTSAAAPPPLNSSSEYRKWLTPRA